MMIYCGIDGQRGEYAAIDRREEEKKNLRVEYISYGYDGR